MSRRVLLPCALLALSVLLPCFVGNSGNGSHGRALRVLREGTAAPKATTETPKPKETPKETPKAETPKAETPKSVALVQVTKETLGEFLMKGIVKEAKDRIIVEDLGESIKVKDVKGWIFPTRY